MALGQGRGLGFGSVPIWTLVFAAIGLVGNDTFYLSAIGRIGAAEANVVHYRWPVFLVLLAALLYRRVPSRIQMVAIAVGLAGVIVALRPRMGGDLDVFGVLLGACGALKFAVCSISRSRATFEGGVIGPALALRGCAALCIHIVLEPAYMPDLSERLVIVLMTLGPFTLANVLWDRATRAGAAATIASLAFLTPLVGIRLLAVFGLQKVTSDIVARTLLAIVGAVLGSQSKELDGQRGEGHLPPHSQPRK